jgi:hypothetical protein
LEQIRAGKEIVPHFSALSFQPVTLRRVRKIAGIVVLPPPNHYIWEFNMLLIKSLRLFDSFFKNLRKIFFYAAESAKTVRTPGEARLRASAPPRPCGFYGLSGAMTVRTDERSISQEFPPAPPL